MEIIASAFALAAGFGIVFGLVLAVHWGRQWEIGLAPYIFYGVLAVVAFGALTSGRNFSLGVEFAAAREAFKNPAVVWVGRLTSLFVLVACSERILHLIFMNGRRPDVPKVLLFAFWIYFLCDIISPALLGRHRSVSHEYLYMMLAGTAALLANRAGADAALRSIRNALFIFLVLSALCALWKPDIVMERHYTGLVPMLSIRYGGLANHPNSLGPLAVVFMLCLWSRPLPRWLNSFGWLLGAVSLLLTQSKTSLLSSIVCFSCLVWFGYRNQLKARLLDSRHPELPVGLLVMAMLGTILLAAMVMFTGVSDRLGHFFASRAGADLVSLTGRDQIWRVAIEEWHRNPLFGYGLTIWDQGYRQSVGLLAAFHAHSQFYQSLASAGLIGAAGLLIYGLALFYFSLRTAKASEGMSVALFLLIAIRCVSEVPLSMTGLSAEQVAHFLMLILIAANYHPHPPHTEVKSIRSSARGWRAA